jgi:hypothetical protein
MMLSEEAFHNHVRYLMKSSHTYIVFIYNIAIIKLDPPNITFKNVLFQTTLTLQAHDSCSVF